MKPAAISVIAFMAMSAAIAQASAQTAAPAASVDSFEAPITGAKGEAIGRVSIRSGANASVVRIAITAGGLAPGWHGLHFHAVGDCSDIGQFQLSKGHVNHDDSKHGLLNPDGPDDGDMPNLFANADGSANAEVPTELRLAGPQGLRDQDGSALLIHANEDDHMAQPIGNAGGRVACAVIK